MWNTLPGLKKIVVNCESKWKQISMILQVHTQCWVPSSNQLLTIKAEMLFLYCGVSHFTVSFLSSRFYASGPDSVSVDSPFRDKHNFLEYYAYTISTYIKKYKYINLINNICIYGHFYFAFMHGSARTQHKAYYKLQNCIGYSIS